MIVFEKTTHLSEILEKSEQNPVIIFKHSSKCYQSDVIKEMLERAKNENKIEAIIFLVVVQDSPVLSKKIAEVFGIKHESPQIIILKNKKTTYFESHDKIMIEEFRYDSIQG